MYLILSLLYSVGSFLGYTRVETGNFILIIVTLSQNQIRIFALSDGLLLHKKLI